MRTPVFMTYNRSPINKHCLWGRINRQPMPRPLSLVGHVDRASKSRGTQPAERAAHRSRTRTARKYAVAQRSLLVSKCTPGAKDADHTVIPVAALAGCKVRGNGQMISAVECREHAVECRQMSERAPSPRVRDILIDMARSWERLALETEHSAPTSAKLVLRHQFRREL